MADHPIVDPPRPEEGPATRETTLGSLSLQAVSFSDLTLLHTEAEATGDTPQSFELVQRISDGGQATVFKAKTRDTRELVAIKIFKTAEDDPAQKQRFQREAQILASLKHPNIVTYKGAFIAEGEWGEARQCLVMEFLDGLSLKDYIQKHPQGCPWSAAVDIFRQSLSALIFARTEGGVIHRDIKPSNIHVLPDGSVKLIDFGIARTDIVSSTHTSGSGLLGSFDYMAPDFARVKESTFRGDEISDIFSLFACFHELITGKLPYTRFGERPELEYLRRWHGNVTASSTEHPIFRVITHLSRFMHKGLAPDRKVRYQSLDEVLKEFNALKPRVIVRGKHERYVLTDALGAGGFSEVYKARRESDGMTVAIKRLFANRSLARFIKEGEILSLHPHPNVVRYHDFFETESASGRTDSFLVMEYLDGMPGWSLRERIREHPDGLPADEMLETFGYYLATLAYLYRHKHSIVHRDIKPANLYAPEGQPAKAKLLDFGGARDVTGTKTTGGLPGTWDYMAPEFVTGGTRGTHQSDLYALGLSLYEALTGRPAYPRLPRAEREALNELLARVRGQSKQQIDFHHEVFVQHPQLVAIIQHATARLPKVRYADASQMREDLGRVLKADFGRNLPPEETLAPLDAAKESTAANISSRLLNPFHLAKTQHRRKVWSQTARLFVLLAMLSLAAWIAWLNRGELAAAVSIIKQQATIRFRHGTRSFLPARPGPTATLIVAVHAPPTETPLPQDSPPANAPPPLQDNRQQLINELQLKLEPLSYFVVASSKFDTLRVEILKSAGILNRTITAPKYAPVVSEPAIYEARTAIWLGFFSEIMSILQEQNDLTLLPLARGCIYVLFNLQSTTAPGASFQAQYEHVLDEIRRRYSDLPLGQHLPLPSTQGMRIALAPDGAWLTDPYLDDVFARADSQDVRARMLPQRAILDLNARTPAGAIKRKWEMFFALVPDGSVGALKNANPFYMASVETQTEAMRCYRDDAARWDAEAKSSFSGVVAGRTLGPNDPPYAQASPTEALEFCNWASALVGLPPVYQKDATGQWVADLQQPGFRLPTANEWEYAARYGFDFMQKPKARTWETMQATLQAEDLVHFYFKHEPRVSKESPPYPLGLYDLCGNVEEICMASSSHELVFVLKGGSAKSRVASEVSPSYEARTIDATHEFVGFRIVLPMPIEVF